MAQAAQIIIIASSIQRENMLIYVVVVVVETTLQCRQKKNGLLHTIFDMETTNKNSTELLFSTHLWISHIRTARWIISFFGIWNLAPLRWKFLFCLRLRRSKTAICYTNNERFRFVLNFNIFMDRDIVVYIHCVPSKSHVNHLLHLQPFPIEISTERHLLGMCCVYSFVLRPPWNMKPQTIFGEFSHLFDDCKEIFLPLLL